MSEELSVTQLVDAIERIPESIRPKDRGILELATERLQSLDHEVTELEERIDQIGKTPTELVTVYPHGIKIGRIDAPLPRFQFRWAVDPDRMSSFLCFYEYCWELSEADIRNDFGHREARVILGRTRVGTDAAPWQRSLSSATPFRDGAHARWDAPAFGNPPTYIVSPEGEFALREQEQSQ